MTLHPHIKLSDACYVLVKVFDEYIYGLGAQSNDYVLFNSAHGHILSWVDLLLWIVPFLDMLSCVCDVGTRNNHHVLINDT